MGRQAPEGLIGIHLSLLAGALGIADKLPAKSKRNARHTTRSRRSGRVASATSWNSPRGHRRSATDCSIHPVGLAAWLLDHDTDSYYKISRAFVDVRP